MSLLSLPERWQRLIQPEPMSGCWLWIGAVNSDGYGHVRCKIAGAWKTRGAHRQIYLELRGPLPQHLTLDHLCRIRSCVNPAHLDPVPHRVNILRGEGFAAKLLRRTHCRRGHPLLPGAGSHEGHRVCPVCACESKRASELRARLKRGPIARKFKLDATGLARLRALRVNGLRQKDVAVLLGISQTHISRIERGETALGRMGAP